MAFTIERREQGVFTLWEDSMPKLQEIDITYDQILELVHQLEFEQRMALIRTVMHEQEYRKNFYRYTESVRKKYHIPTMTEEELDMLLHDID